MKYLVDALDSLLKPTMSEADQDLLVDVMLEADVSELEELDAFDDAELEDLGLSEGIISKIRGFIHGKQLKHAQATQRTHSEIAKAKGIHTPEGAKAHFKAVKAGVKVSKLKSNRPDRRESVGKKVGVASRPRPAAQQKTTVQTRPASKTTIQAHPGPDKAARRAHLAKVVGSAFAKEKNLVSRRIHARAAIFQRKEGKRSGSAPVAHVAPAPRPDSRNTGKSGRREKLLAKISPKVQSHIKAMSPEQKSKHLVKKTSRVISKINRSAEANREHAFADAKTHIPRKPLPRYGTPHLTAD